MPAIAVTGEPFNVKRCFAFGYLLPVNSKKADAGMRQRLLCAKWRPSERKLNTGAPPSRLGGKLKVMGTSSILLARITGPVDPHVVGPREIKLSLLAGNAQLQTLHHLAVFAPTDVLLIVAAYPPNVGSVQDRREGQATCAINHSRRSAPAGRCRRAARRVIECFGGPLRS